MTCRSHVPCRKALLASILAAGLWAGCQAVPSAVHPVQQSNLQRAKIFLAAGDFRHAIEACRQEVQEHPGAESYLYLTYVYQALGAYVEFLARADRWVAMEHVYLNLTSGTPEDLVDPPNVLARMAKEMIQESVRQQADVTAELATRLDSSKVSHLWPQQNAWRRARPDDWWFSIPPEWSW